MSAKSSGSPAVEIEVDDRVVRISNPDRVYFPARGETKLDLVEYYLTVGDGIVNALRERPCMLHRFPEGVSGEKVHQKRVPRGAPPWLETVRVKFPRYDRHADELCVTELASVIWAVQMSTVEFHPWNSRRADVEKRADYLRHVHAEIESARLREGEEERIEEEAAQLGDRVVAREGEVPLQRILLSGAADVIPVFIRGYFADPQDTTLPARPRVIVARRGYLALDEERKTAILRAVVQVYSSPAQAVGSTSIVRAAWRKRSGAGLPCST